MGSFGRFLKTSARLTTRWDESLPQRYLNDQVQHAIAHNVPEFPWGSRGEDEVAHEAVAWLQRHYTPQLKNGRVVWIAVQHIDWLEAEWSDRDVTLPLSKTGYVAVLVDEHSCDMANAIDNCRSAVVAAQQHSMPDKKREAKAAARKHLMGLLPYVLALFDAQTPDNLLSDHPSYQAHAGAEYLQLRKMQTDLDCNHQDAPVVLGDFNSLYIFHADPSDQSQVNHCRTYPRDRSAAAAYVRDLLEEGAAGVWSYLEENREHGGPGTGVASPDHGEGAAGGSQGCNLGVQPRQEGSGSGFGTVRGTGDVMYDECAASHAAAQDIYDYFQLPEVYEALGLTEAPKTAPLWELDAWGESAYVVLNPKHGQDHKLLGRGLARLWHRTAAASTIMELLCIVLSDHRFSTFQNSRS